MMWPSKFQVGGPFGLLWVWSIECGGSDFVPTGRRYRRRVRIGWLTFDVGEYDERPVGSGAYYQALLEFSRQARVARLAVLGFEEVPDGVGAMKDVLYPPKESGR